MAGPVISLTSSAQSFEARERRKAEVEKFCRWIECAEIVKGWKPWFLGAFDHDFVTFAESREKAFAKFVLGNGRCYKTASMWSDTLGREIMPSDVREIPGFMAEAWLMDEDDGEKLNSVTLTLDRVRTVKLLVLPGTMLRGWNTAFLKPEDAAFLFENYNSSLGFAMDDREYDEEDVVDEGVVRCYELPAPSENGLIEVLFCFDDGTSLAYDNPDDDPMTPEGGER